MASNLRVDNIQPTTGTGIGIGTANGSVTFNADVTGGLNISTGSVGVGTDNPEHKFHLYTGTLGIGKSENTGFEILIDNNNLTFSRDSKSYINQVGSGTISIRLGSSYTEVAEFNSDGLKLASGKGIDFSATADGSGSSNVSELLDDYEEGTFTPSLTFATPGTSSFSYSVQSGWYTKIGRMVHYRLELRLTAFSKGTASGDLRISGLPFTSANFGAGQFTGSFGAFYAPLPTSAGHFPFFGARLNSTEGFFKVLRNNASWDTFPDPDANAQYKCDVTVFTI